MVQRRPFTVNIRLSDLKDQKVEPIRGLGTHSDIITIADGESYFNLVPSGGIPEEIKIKILGSIVTKA